MLVHGRSRVEKTRSGVGNTRSGVRTTNPLVMTRCVWVSNANKFSIPSLLAKMFKELLNYVVTKVLDQVEELGGVDVSTFVPPWLDEGPGQGVAHRGLVILLEDFLGHDGGEGHGYSHWAQLEGHDWVVGLGQRGERAVGLRTRLMDISDYE